MFLYLIKYYLEAKMFLLLPEKYVKRTQLRRVRKAFEWAKENSVFYNQLYKKEGIFTLEIKSFDDIKKIPIVDKGLMKEYELDELLTKTNKDDLVAVRTSGTNGVPFDVYSSKKEHFTSYVRTFLSLQGYNPFQKFGLIGVFEQKERIEKQTFLYFLQQRLKLFRRKTFHVYTPHNELLQQLREQKINLLASSPSCLKALTDELERKNEFLPIKTIVVSGEKLTESAREGIKKYFGSRIINVFGCMELPSMAWTKPDGLISTYLPNSVFIEYVNPTEINGEIYGELVITNLINKTMPFVRYKVGDHVKLQDIYTKMGPIDGRAEDVLTLRNGKKIYMVLLYVFAKIDGISQYRFVQKKNKSIYMEVAKKDGVEQETLSAKILTIWKKHFADEPLNIEFKNDLPIISKSGKFKRLEVEK